MQFGTPAGAGDEPRIDMAPLIDVIFLLLIFFLLTTSFVKNRTIEVRLPGSKGQSEKLDPDALVVVLTRDGRILHAGNEVSLAELSSVFDEASGRDPGPIVLLQADEEVTHGRVVQLMDLARDAGIYNLAIATKAENR